LAVIAPDLIGLFIEPLEGTGIPYMITGGVASVIYGDPRFTRDIDIVLELQRDNIPRLVSAFATEDFYVPPLEVLEEEVARRPEGHFNVIHKETALRADVYLAGDDPLHVWAFGRKHRIELERSAIWVAPIEYVILRKLEYFRASGSDRHLRDVAMMFRISGDMIDRPELASWTETLGLQEIADSARKHFTAE
jgi:Nucleotidyl transferase AbiEii toxin, Type IV TA system